MCSILVGSGRTRLFVQAWLSMQLLSACAVQLWFAYLRERALAVRGLPPQHRMWEGLVNTYERAMVSMHKMPRMWIDFLQLLVDLRWVTRTRRAFDRALCALPITQHDRIWQMYLVRPAL